MLGTLSTWPQGGTGRAEPTTPAFICTVRAQTLDSCTKEQDIVSDKHGLRTSVQLARGEDALIRKIEAMKAMLCLFFELT